jgi:hypothetical protein
VFAAGMAVLCGAVALVVHRQPPERVTVANYVMGVVLPWGYRVGRGKLAAIVATSWAVWVLVGLSVVLATDARMHKAEQPPIGAAETAGTAVATSTAGGGRSTAVMTLLALAWLVDGAALLHCAGVLATSSNARHMARTMTPLLVVLVAMLAASVALVTLSSSASAARLALLIAGVPPLFVGVGYGVFVLVVVTVGRNTRWN